MYQTLPKLIEQSIRVHAVAELFPQPCGGNGKCLNIRFSDHKNEVQIFHRKSSCSTFYTNLILFLVDVATALQYGEDDLMHLVKTMFF